MRSKPRRKAQPAGLGGPTLGKQGRSSQEESPWAPISGQAEGRSRGDSSREDLGRERIDKMGIAMGGLEKVEDLINTIGEVENRESIRPLPKEHSPLRGSGGSDPDTGPAALDRPNLGL